MILGIILIITDNRRDILGIINFILTDDQPEKGAAAA